MSEFRFVGATLGALLLLSGCVSASSDAVAPVWAELRTLPPEPVGAPSSRLRSPLDLPTALATGLQHNPEIRQALASVMQAEGERVAAGSLHNPLLELSLLDGNDAAQPQLALSLLAPLAQIITRKGEMARAERQLHVRQLEAVDIISAQTARIESAHAELIAAQQLLDVAVQAHERARTALELGQQFHAAGNIPQRDLIRLRADAIRHRDDRLEALQDREDAWFRLADQIGVDAGEPGRASGELSSQTLAPLDHTQRTVAEMTQWVLEHHPALRALQLAAELSEEEKTRRLRELRLGDLEAGLEAERETDGERLWGVALGWRPPIFDTGRGDRIIADSLAEASRARLAARVTAIRNEIRRAHRMRELARVRIANAEALSSTERRDLDLGMQELQFMLSDVFVELDARSAATEARRMLIQAQLDERMAEIHLRRALGLLSPAVRTLDEEDAR